VVDGYRSLKGPGGIGIDRSLADAGLEWLTATLQRPFLRTMAIIAFPREGPQMASLTSFTRFSPVTIEMDVSLIRFRADIWGRGEKALQVFERIVQVPPNIKALELQVFPLCFGSPARGH
jgi:hypothetical protein